MTLIETLKKWDFEQPLPGFAPKLWVKDDIEIHLVDDNTFYLNERIDLPNKTLHTYVNAEQLFNLIVAQYAKNLLSSLRS